MFGIVVSMVESIIFGEMSSLVNYEGSAAKGAAYYVSFAAVNFITYSCIPLFIKLSGATLLNISNLTTALWSMLADILFFDQQ